jgi:hypothetical protein
MEDTWWIEYIVATPPFLTNFRVDMTNFMDIHKVVVKRSAFWTSSSAWNESESKGGAKSGGLKHQFSQVERDLNLQEMFEPIPIPKKNT